MSHDVQTNHTLVFVGNVRLLNNVPVSESMDQDGRILATVVFIGEHVEEVEYNVRKVDHVHILYHQEVAQKKCLIRYIQSNQNPFSDTHGRGEVLVCLPIHDYNEMSVGRRLACISDTVQKEQQMWKRVVEQVQEEFTNIVGEMSTQQLYNLEVAASQGNTEYRQRHRVACFCSCGHLLDAWKQIEAKVHAYMSSLDLFLSLQVYDGNAASDVWDVVFVFSWVQP